MLLMTITQTHLHKVLQSDFTLQIHYLKAHQFAFFLPEASFILSDIIRILTKVTLNSKLKPEIVRNDLKAIN